VITQLHGNATVLAGRRQWRMTTFDSCQPRLLNRSSPELTYHPAKFYRACIRAFFWRMTHLTVDLQYDFCGFLRSPTANTSARISKQTMSNRRFRARTYLSLVKKQTLTFKLHFLWTTILGLDLAHAQWPQTHSSQRPVEDVITHKSRIMLKLSGWADQVTRHANHVLKVNRSGVISHITHQR